MEEFAPVTVAIVNDYPVVVRGVAELLRDDPRLDVVEIDSVAKPAQSVNVVLFDAFAATQEAAGVTRLITDPRYDRVVIYSWNVQEPRVRQALGLGIDGYLSKSLSAGELADALVRAHDGECVIELGDLATEMARGPHDGECVIELGDLATEMARGRWPGQTEGLSAREAEIVALITQGVTNEDIARMCYLSINSVKSYIRSAYRKMGVERRSQAVLWGIQNGMVPKVTQLQS